LDADQPFLFWALMNSGQLATSAELDDSLGQMTLQLHTAQAALAQAQRTQSEFLWGLCHALRSPLTAILGFAQLMDAGVPSPTPRQKSSIAQILQAGWGLLALIDEILDASLIECGKLKLQMEHISVEDVLRDCETLVEPLARQSNVQVVFIWPSQPLFISADRTRLRQILMALLGHSLSHSGAAEVVQVSCCRSTNGRLRVNFQDTSCGKSTAWLAQSNPANHIKLIVSQQLAGYMGGVIATDFAANAAGNTASNASAYWLELNIADGAK
jgi:signal transduction histidine kinase